MDFYGYNSVKEAGEKETGETRTGKRSTQKEKSPCQGGSKEEKEKGR